MEGAKPGAMVRFEGNGETLGAAMADDDGRARLEVVWPATDGIAAVEFSASTYEGAGGATLTTTTVECQTIPGMYETVRHAVNAASNGDAVCVAAGTYVRRVELTGRDVMVLGEDEATIVLDGGGYQRW